MRPEYTSESPLSGTERIVFHNRSDWHRIEYGLSSSAAPLLTQSGNCAHTVDRNLRFKSEDMTLFPFIVPEMNIKEGKVERMREEAKLHQRRRHAK